MRQLGNHMEDKHTTHSLQQASAVSVNIWAGPRASLPWEGSLCLPGQSASMSGLSLSDASTTFLPPV